MTETAGQVRVRRPRPVKTVLDPPLATYRLQLGPDLGFADAAGLVGYLGDLGVSHLYLSPILTARPGSTHGYDVADPGTVAGILGGEEGLRALAAAAHAAGLGLVVDIVPNHLGTGFETVLWRDLLAGGQSGSAGSVFDVDWTPALPAAAGKVVIPVLGGQYGEVLHAGELALVEEDGELRIAYADHRFPVSPGTVQAVGRSGGPAALKGVPGEPGTWQRLHGLLERQWYRLVYWRAGSALVNYRRFFSIDELAGVRVEDEAVFDRTHHKILELVADGVIDGLRIDHPDGMRDPARYFARLQERAGGRWMVVEKITAPAEPLRDWPVAGTTGYEFCNQVLGLFVDPEAAPVLDAVDAALGGDPRPYHAQVEAAKREMLDGELATDVRRLARLLWVLLQEHPEVRDVDDRECLAALSDVLAALDVYRTFVDPLTGEASDEDRARVAAAVAAATRSASAPAVLYPFLERLLTGEAGDDPAHLDVLARAQQLSGALTAKGVEDTVFYRYRRLLAVNEVGGEPVHLGLDVAAFHRLQADRAAAHPAAMVTTATHDTKRGEDARLRIAALSELAGRWQADALRWHEQFQPLVSQTAGGPAPDPQTESLLYQTLVAVWPVVPGVGDGDPTEALKGVRQRVKDYGIKACREARQRTSWRDPDEAFERGVVRFIDSLLDNPRAREEIGSLAAAAAEIAMVSGLAQVLLRCTVPGVPDTYQGTEGWDDSLVDPDNRRPVDFALRRHVLAELDSEPPDPAELWAVRHDGRIKAWVLSRALRARRDQATSVGQGGGYLPLTVSGELGEHVVAFARTDGAGSPGLVTVAPRLPGRLMQRAGRPPLGETWTDTMLALPQEVRWRDRLTGAVHEGDGLLLSVVLATLPVALLTPG